MAFWNNHYVDRCDEVVLALPEKFAKNPLDAVARNCGPELSAYGEANAIARVPFGAGKHEQNEVPRVNFSAQVITDLEFGALAETALSRPA